MLTKNTCLFFLELSAFSLDWIHCFWSAIIKESSIYGVAVTLSEVCQCGYHLKLLLVVKSKQSTEVSNFLASQIGLLFSQNAEPYFGIRKTYFKAITSHTTLEWIQKAIDSPKEDLLEIL